MLFLIFIYLFLVVLGLVAALWLFLVVMSGCDEGGDKEGSSLDSVTPDTPIVAFPPQEPKAQNLVLYLKT